MLYLQIGPICIHYNKNVLGAFPIEFDEYFCRCKHNRLLTHYSIIKEKKLINNKLAKVSVFTQVGSHVFLFVRKMSSKLILLHGEKCHNGRKQQVSIFNNSHKILVHEGRSDRESTMILRHPMDALLVTYLLALDKLGVSLHSTASIIDKKAYLFIGTSGTGKSTLALLFNQKFKDGTFSGEVLNDERTIVYGKTKISGTPWSGTAKLRSPSTAKLAGIYILQKGREPKFEEISKKDAFLKLQQCLYAPYGWRPGMEFSIDYLLDLLDCVPFKRFIFPPTQDSVDYFVKSVCNAH